MILSSAARLSRSGWSTSPATRMGLAVSKVDDLVFQCDRWHVQMNPAALLKQWPARSSSCKRCMTAMIAPVRLSLRRETRVPPYQSITFLRATSDWSLVGVEGIVDDDRIAAASGQRPADRGRISAAAPGRDEFLRGLFFPLRAGKELRVPGRLDDLSKLPMKLGGEVAGIARDDEAPRWILTQRPGDIRRPRCRSISATAAAD